MCAGRVVRCCFATLLITGSVAVLGCKREHPNIVLITIDTLRADHLGCYGYERDTSPHVDRLAQDGVLFTRAFSPDTQSSPTFASIHTAVYPRAHGVWRNAHKLRTNRPLLAEILRHYGYRTGAFVNSRLIGVENGFDRGFDEFRTLIGYARRDPRLGGEETFDAASDWIRQTPEPFFVWLQCEYPHAPYYPAAPFDTRFGKGPRELERPWNYTHPARDLYVQGEHPTAEEREHVISLYDGEVAFADAGIGRLIDTLRETGRYDDSIVIVTGDHGETLLERPGITGHRGKFYDEVLHVPLVIKLPGNRLAGRSFESLVQTLDLMPTLLELAGIEVPVGLHGVSLVPLLQGDPTGPRDVVFAELLIDLKKYGGPVATLRTDRWKLIRRNNGQDELYDLQTDPEERTNLIHDQPEVAARLASRIQDWQEAHPRDEDGSAGLVVSEEMRRVLEGAGYLDSDVGVAPQTPSSASTPERREAR